MGDLAKFLRVEPSTATRAIERLEQSGLVLRVPDPTDARAVHVTAADLGLDQFAAVGGRSAKLLDAALVDFTPQDREVLAELLDRLVAGIEDLMEARA